MFSSLMLPFTSKSIFFFLCLYCFAPVSFYDNLNRPKKECALLQVKQLISPFSSEKIFFLHKVKPQSYL